MICPTHQVTLLYADDTEICATSNDCVNLVSKVNIDLERSYQWMLQNKIGSSYDLKNKVSSNPILINNKPIQ